MISISSRQRVLLRIRERKEVVLVMKRMAVTKAVASGKKVGYWHKLDWIWSRTNGFTSC